MPQTSHSLFRNRLLSTLPRHEYERLLPRLKIVPLPKGKIIAANFWTNCRPAFNAARRPKLRPRGRN